MELPYQQIDVEPVENITLVRLRRRRLDEAAFHTLGNELTDLIERGGRRYIVLSLGPGNLDCLYSVFLSKLVMVQRRLHDRHGVMILCDLTPDVATVFEACRLQGYFEFAKDRAAALEAMAKKIPQC
jgi:anti-anti-sigma factor